MTDSGRTPECYPTSDEINALPEKFRRYIHDLVTKCDPTGDVQTIAQLREDREALQMRVEELEPELTAMRKDPDNLSDSTPRGLSDSLSTPPVTRPRRPGLHFTAGDV